MAIRATNYDETQEYDVAEMGDLCNDNLLINSDFRNPINQRGKTSYTWKLGSYGYTIDRWLGNGGNTISIEDGYVRIKVNDDTRVYSLFRQTVEIAENQIPDTMTLSFEMRASKQFKFQLYDTERYLTIDTDWKTYAITFTKDELGTGLGDGYIKVWLGIKDYDEPNVGYLNPGDYFDVKWAKLEQGSFATPFVPRHYGEELALCQRYLFPILRWGGTYTERGDERYYTMFVPNLIMRTNPTATEAPAAQIIGFMNSGTVIPTQSVSNFSACYQRKNGIEIAFNIVGTSGINFGVGVFTKDFFLDAEIY